MKSIHIDFETYSPQELGDVGAYRYAEDPHARILLCAVGIDSSPVVVWRHNNRQHEESIAAIEYIRQAVADGRYQWFAHNAQFEMAIAYYRWAKDMGIMADPFALDWQCTAAAARRAGLPASLDKVGEVLGLPVRKEADGKRLIRKFSINGAVPADHPDDWQFFIEYCRKDVQVEKLVASRLARFLPSSDRSGVSQMAWTTDVIVNRNGIPVDVESLEKARVILRQAESGLIARFVQLTGLKPSQTAAFTAWLKERGWPHKGVSAPELAQGYPEGSNELQEAISLRQAMSFSATKKVQPMLDCACADGRVRGTLQYYGALTGRWSGRLIQPQNFKRPTIRHTHEVMAHLRSTAHPTAGEIEMLYGSPLEVISSCIRHFIRHPEYDLLDADYAAIEARLVCWLAGEDRALREYAAGVDRYKRMACIIFGKQEKDITSDERFIGKGVILGAGYGMGPAKFFENTNALAEAMGITGIKVTPQLAERAIAAWRSQHPKVVRYWYDCENAAKWVLAHQGVWKPVCNVAFCSENINGMRYLMIRLPSGRVLYYPKAGLSSDGSLQFFGRVPGKANYDMVGTYSGRIVENITQAVAADIMATGAYRCIEDGYEVVALIHDQALAIATPDKPLDRFVQNLKTLPAWAKGLPLDAEGKTTDYYRK